MHEMVTFYQICSNVALRAIPESTPPSLAGMISRNRVLPFCKFRNMKRLALQGHHRNSKQ